MTNEIATKLQLVGNNLKELLDKKASALPKNFNETRFLQNCLTVLTETEGIEKCVPQDVAKVMLKGAFLGLDFFNKECYAIIYAGTVKFQTDYKGDIKVSKRWATRAIKDIYAKLVKEDDQFEIFIKEGKQIINFKPIPFNNKKTVGAFAIVYFEDGSMSYDTMSVEEIEETKQNYAKKNKEGKFSPSWRKSPGEMQKKTVLHRICKLIDIDFDNEDQRKAFEEGGDFDKKKIKETIDVEAVKDPFDVKQEETPDAQPSPEYLKIKKENPEYEDWQIQAILKEQNETK